MEVKGDFQESLEGLGVHAGTCAQGASGTEPGIALSSTLSTYKPVATVSTAVSRGTLHIYTAPRTRYCALWRPDFCHFEGFRLPNRWVLRAIGLLQQTPKASGRKARPARQKRSAVCELRFRRLTLPPTRRGLEPVSLWGVHLVGAAPPPEEEAVQWHLLTSPAVKDADAAAKIVSHYLQRWRIKDYFRVLKSGCRVEHLAFRTADRLHRAIAINSVIAWRLLAMTRLGRQVPDCAAELLFTDHEPRFIGSYAREFRQPEPERLGSAVRLVAHLGTTGVASTILNRATSSCGRATTR